MTDPTTGLKSGCDPLWAERVSARQDGALDATEARQLALHLPGCAVCRALDARLASVVRTVRAARPLAPLAPADLDARLRALAGKLASTAALAAAEAAGLATESDARLTLAPSPSRAPASEAATVPLPAVPPEPAWRDGVRRWGPFGVKVAKGLMVAVFVGVAVTFFRARLAEFRADLALRDAPPGGPTIADTPRPPKPPEEQPSAPVRVEDPIPPETPTPPPRTPGDDPDVPPIAPPPEDPPPRTPLVTPVDPSDPGATPDDGPGKTSPGQEPRIVVQVDRDALERLLAQIRDRATPADQRPGMIEALGDRRFDHERCYGLLANVLAVPGELDTVERAPDCRRSAIEALARLGTVGAATVLATAPARPASFDADEGALLAALLRVQDDAAVARVAELVPATQDDGRRFLLLRALGELGRPAAVPGLLALLPGGAPRGRDPRLGGPLLRAAADALGATKDPRAEAPLVAALEGDGDGRLALLRQGAALGLGALVAAHEPPAMAVALGSLAKAAGDRDDAVARAAVRGLGHAGRREAVVALVERTDPEVEKRPLVRGLAHESLLLLTGQRFATAAAWRTWLQGAPALPRVGALRPLSASDDAAFFRLPGLAARVVFVIDMSGSMAGGKWELVTFELRRALERLGPQTGFDVLLFSDATKPVFGRLEPGTRANIDRALRFVEQQRLVHSATTAIGPALRRALGEGYPRVDTIYFVSDGADTRQAEIALRQAIARENLSRPEPARIHAILVRQGGEGLVLDPGPDDPRHPLDIRFMRGLARDSGGVFVRN